MAPVGRRVGIETLEGKVLAIDVSIWLIQFVKAMRDQQTGRPLENAHILGSFRRLLKLVFARIRPVFVFDGVAPSLKRRTLMVRASRRKKAEASLRETARAILINQIQQQQIEQRARARQIDSDGTSARPQFNRVDSSGRVSMSIGEQSSSSGTGDGSANIERNNRNDNGAYATDFDAKASRSRSSRSASSADAARKRIAAAKNTAYVSSHSSSESNESEISEESEAESDAVAYTDNSSSFDFDSLRSLPIKMQKKALDSLERRQREENRSIIVTHAEDPEDFSNSQIQAYIKKSRMNQKIKKARVEMHSHNEGQGALRKIASQPGRRYLFAEGPDADEIAQKSIEAARQNERNQSLIFRAKMDARKKSKRSQRGANSIQSSEKYGDPDIQIAIQQSLMDLHESKGSRNSQGLDFMEENPASRRNNTSQQITAIEKRSSAAEAIFPLSGDVGSSSSRFYGVGLASRQSSKLDISAEGLFFGRASMVKRSEAGWLKGNDEYAGRSIESASSDEEKDKELSLALRRLKSKGKKKRKKKKKRKRKKKRNEEGGGKHLENQTGTNSSSSGKRIHIDSLGSPNDDAGARFYSSGYMKKDERIPQPAQLGQKRSLSVVTSDEDYPSKKTRVVDNGTSLKTGSVVWEDQSISSIQSIEEEYECGGFIVSGADSSDEPSGGGFVNLEEPSIDLNFAEQGGATYQRHEAIKNNGNTNYGVFTHDDEKGRIPTSRQAPSASQDSDDAIKSVSLDNESSNIKQVTADSGVHSQDSDVWSSSGEDDANLSIPIVDTKADQLRLDQSSGYSDRPDMIAKECNLTNQEAEKVGSASQSQSQKKMKPADSAISIASSLRPWAARALRRTYAETATSNGSADSTNHTESTSSVATRSDSGSTSKKLLSDGTGASFFPRVESTSEPSATQIPVAKSLDMESSAVNGNATIDSSAKMAEAQALQRLQSEEAGLTSKQHAAARDAGGEVTPEMREDLCTLLRLFGIPFVMAPSEAEAQCAALEMKGLVDGVVTDDSDVWLFGATEVYKNIFDERKYVEMYRARDVLDELGLDREANICLALLLGSDYTPGVQGIGIVNATEIIRVFPGEKGLKDFKHWIDTAEQDELIDGGRTRGSRRKLTSEQVAELDPLEQFKYKHRKARRRWRLNEGFPSPAVLNAYRSPQVDNSSEQFSWGTPDLMGLRLFMEQKLSWSEAETDRHLLPVMKELSQNQKAQTRIDGYFSLSYSDNKRAAMFKSKRLIEATQAIRKQREQAIPANNKEEE